MSFLLNILKKYLLRFIDFKALGLVLTFLFLLASLFYLNSKLNEYSKQLEAKKQELEKVTKEHKKELEQTAIKQSLETGSKVFKQEQKSYLKKLNEEVKIRDKKLNTVKKIYKKRGLNAKNKEPPDNSSSRNFIVLEF